MAKAENFQKICEHLNNLLKKLKVRTTFDNKILFQLVPGFRNIQEKLEKVFYLEENISKER